MIINKKYLDEIDLIRELVPEAQKPERTAILNDGEWTTKRITALNTLVDDLETAALAAVGRTAARKMDTAEEKTARKDLLAAISPIRTGAKRKYRNSLEADAGRDAFFVNGSTSVSLERLLFISGSMHAKLAPPSGGGAPEYTLPGVTPAKIDKVEEMREKYGDANALQSDTENIRRQSHVDAQTLYTKAKAERIDPQLAADQGWTFHNPENAAVRGAFKVPPTNRSRDERVRGARTVCNFAKIFAIRSNFVGNQTSPSSRIGSLGCGKAATPALAKREPKQQE